MDGVTPESENEGMIFDPNSGFYYDLSSGLYFDPASEQYFEYTPEDPTTQVISTQQPVEQVQWEQSAPYQGQPLAASPAPTNNNNLIVGALVAGLLLLAGIGGFFYMKQSNDTSNLSSASGTDSTTYSTSTRTSVYTSTATSTSTRTSTPSTTQRPSSISLPGYHEPATEGANTNYVSNFQDAWSGSSVTSTDFAYEVYKAYRAEWKSSGNTSFVLPSVYSPVTGDSYSMNCNDNGSYVTCTGGNNAVVYIA